VRRRRVLRTAIVGAGLMGRWHAPAIRRAGGRVVAVQDRDEFRAARLAQRTGATVYGDLPTLLSAAAPDVVHVCTPAESHRSLAGEALERGVAVIVEKPLGVTLRETEQLLDLAAARGVVICPVHQFPFQRGVRRALRLLPAMGEVLHAEYSACTAGGVGKGPALRDAVVADILPHPLSLLHRVWPGTLARAEWRVLRPQTGEFLAVAAVGSGLASIRLSLEARPPRNTLSLYAERGTVHLDLFHGFAVTEPGGTSRMGKIARPFGLAWRSGVAAGTNLLRRAAVWEPAYPGLRQLVADAYAAIRNEAAVPVSPAEVRDLALVRDRLLQDPGR
jgi:predicted dehydrogenase